VHTGALRVTVTVVGGVVLGITILALAVFVPAATVKVSVGLVPVLPLGGTLTSDALLLDAVQAHGAVLKVSVPVPPPEPNVKLVGETESDEQLTADWFTVNVATTAFDPLTLLDTLNVPVRAAPVLASTL
jgi:hypothetical protein